MYAPNEDDPSFFTSIFDHLFDFQCEDIILGGNFNLVLNVEKDKKGGMSRTHKKSLEITNNYCESLDLVNVWRVLNPELFKFTWRQRKPEVFNLDLKSRNTLEHNQSRYHSGI